MTETSFSAEASPWHEPDVLADAERVFATAIRDFIAELCLLDGGILIGWVQAARHGNIADLVASSAEPFFKEATIAYADGADVQFDWGRSLTVVLDMEFVTEPVTVFFKLILDGVYVGVAIQRILADRDIRADQDIRTNQDIRAKKEPGFCLAEFKAALEDARLVRAAA
ncbi:MULTISPECIES: hypothetical protein [unclassified Methylobacterium]|uniref:hypothetical protein n=1 Tax=unclassified Methylobacterium TaxID=2615210 RepID=UPI000B221690|nr:MULTISPECIES: hypothetical protein [unclassified Methylobacterium]